MHLDVCNYLQIRYPYPVGVHSTLEPLRKLNFQIMDEPGTFSSWKSTTRGISTIFLPVRRVINRRKLQAANLLNVDTATIEADAIWLGATQPLLTAIQEAAADYWQHPAWQDDTMDESICLTKYEIYWKQTEYLLEMMRYYRQQAVERTRAGIATIPLIRFNTND